MSTILIDYETYYDAYFSLAKVSYEEYINDPRFEVQCVGISVDGAPSYVVFGEKAVQTELRRLFPPGNKHTLVAHNMAFDGSIFCWHNKLEADKYICTQRMAAGLWPHGRHSLDQCCKRAFPDDPSKRKTQELVNFKGVRLEDFTPEQREKMATYCNNDVDITFAFLLYAAKYIPVDELNIISTTLKMFLHRRFVVDKALIESHIEELEITRDKTIKESGVPEKTLKSTTKFAQWIIDKGIPFEKVLAPTLRNPENRKWPLSKDSEEFLRVRNDHPELKAAWDARLLVASNIDLTRAETILRHSRKAPDNEGEQLGCLLNTYAAHTLRWGGGNKSNFQNMKRGSVIRRALCAPDDYEVAVHDQSAIEARMNAWNAGETALLDVWARKGCVYSEFASTIYGREITKKKDPNERFVGKVCILGLGYQMGAARLQRTLQLGLMGPPISITFSRCQEIVWTYRTTYANISEKWNDCEKALRIMMSLGIDQEHQWGCMKLRRNAVQLPNGMYLRYPKLRIQYSEEDDSQQMVYWNGKFWINIYGGKFLENIIQALSRVVMASNILDADELLKRLDGKLNQVALLVHDEIVSVVHKQSAQQYFDQQSAAMRIPPAWCSEGGLTLDVEGGFAKNYSK